MNTLTPHKYSGFPFFMDNVDNYVKNIEQKVCIRFFQLKLKNGITIISSLNTHDGEYAIKYLLKLKNNKNTEVISNIPNKLIKAYDVLDSLFGLYLNGKTEEFNKLIEKHKIKLLSISIFESNILYSNLKSFPIYGNHVDLNVKNNSLLQKSLLFFGYDNPVDFKIIKLRYRKMVSENHPDKNHSENSHKKMILIQKHFNIIKMFLN